MTQVQFHPRRSCLYMPASNERALEKAKSLPADTIIFDLEDAVAPEAKDIARERACKALQSGAYGHRELVVRVNGLDTRWVEDDLGALKEASGNTRLDAILVPKIFTVDDIHSYLKQMNLAGFDKSCALWAMIETPLAVLNIREIAELGSSSPLTTFVMGFNDLAKEMGAEQERTLFTPAMAQSVMAARAFGLNVIDSVYNDFKDLEGFRQECEQARRYGFDGKSLIHPSQIEIANAVFAPSKEKVAEAEAIITAFADPANAGKGAITIDGRMTELLHLKQAEQTVAMAKAITDAGQ